LIYWSGQAYLGLGPSAHSFDGSERSWNVSSLKKYMDGIAAHMPHRETERMSNEEQYHDYLITSLRTKWGANPDYILTSFGAELSNRFHTNSKTFLDKGSMQLSEGRLSIHPDHWLIADFILRELF
jgi:oxygen-independent coproporphyrinogen-3 oxidase